MSKLTLEFNGDPISGRRPRTKGGTFYDPQSKQKEWVALEALSQLQNRCPFKGPICVTFLFCLSFPSSVSRKTRESDPNPFCPIQKDLSNFIKFYEDALNGVVWEDDRQIVQLHAAKIRRQEPKTLIMVSTPSLDEVRLWDSSLKFSTI